MIAPTRPIDCCDGNKGKCTKLSDCYAYRSAINNRLVLAEDGIVTIQEDLDSLDGRVDNAETTITNHGNRLTTIEGKYVTLDTTQTITSVKTFSINKNNYTMILKSSDVDRTDSVSGFTRLTQVELRDKNDASTGYIQNYLDGNGNVVTNYGTVSPNGTGHTLRVTGGDSVGYVTVPNRTYSTSNGSDVVNVNMLKASTDVVHTSGNETVAGTKYFTEQLATKNTTYAYSDTVASNTNIGTVRFYDKNNQSMGEFVNRRYTTGNSRLIWSQITSTGTASMYMEFTSSGTVTLILEKVINGVSSNTTIATL